MAPDPIESIIANPKKVITYTWLASMVFVLKTILSLLILNVKVILGMTFIVMCIAANYLTEGSIDKVAAFSAAWSIILFVIISVIGTASMRRFQSGLSIGIFTGVVIIMSNQMLIVFAIFADRISNGHHNDNVPVEKAMTVFSFFLFLVYGAFAALLLIFQKDIIKDEGVTSNTTGAKSGGADDVVLDDEEMGEDDLPPENI